MESNEAFFQTKPVLVLPCAAAAAVADNPVKVGLTQALGVFIDTLMICSCTAMIMLLTPTKLTEGLVGMDLLQKQWNIISAHSE